MSETTTITKDTDIGVAAAAIYAVHRIHRAEKRRGEGYSRRYLRWLVRKRTGAILTAYSWDIEMPSYTNEENDQATAIARHWLDAGSMWSYKGPGGARVAQRALIWLSTYLEDDGFRDDALRLYEAFHKEWEQEAHA